jgi:hypothetical protein
MLFTCLQLNTVQKHHTLFVPFYSTTCGTSGYDVGISHYLSGPKDLAEIYEGESNENRKKNFKFNLLNESGTQLYHFST